MENCIFCQIAQKSIPASIVYEDDLFIAFNDIRPQAKVHIVLIPKQHFDSVEVLTDTDVNMASQLILVANKIAKAENIDQTGYRLVTNVGPDAGQAVKHLHLHILGGNKLGHIA